MWIDWEEAMILAINDEAETVQFRFVSEPEGVSHGQGFENFGRVTPSFVAWRRAWQDAYERTKDDQLADAETDELWLRVVAEHPIHGHSLNALGERGHEQG